ncbi:MAG: hypothetical protein ACKVU2_01415 [Saprospiraceae bacterium]
MYAVGEKLNVFGDKINVRAALKNLASAAAQLAIGDEVEVRDTAHFSEINGVHER